MTVITVSANLDTNQPLVEESADDGTLKPTAYFEDFLFKLFQDIVAVNDDSGVVETIALNGTDFELEQSGGVSPLTADLVTLDGRNVALTLTDNVLSLTQTQGTSPLTVDLGDSLSSFAGLGNWRYRTETVAPPASGQLRFNNTDPELATLLWINETNDGGADVGNFLGLLTAGDVIYIQERSNSDNFVLVQINNNIDFGTYRQFAIAAVVQQGVALTQNTRVAVVITASGGDFEGSLSSRAFVHSEFMEPPPLGTAGLQVEGILGIAAGVGSGVLSPGIGYDFTNHPGVWGLNTGFTAAGRVFLLSQFPRGFHVGVGGTTRFGAWYQAPAILSDAVDRFVLRAGFNSVILPNTLAQAITFEYQDNENGGRWQAICHDGVETSVDTGITVVASTYYKLEFEVNAAGTSVEFFIDNVSVATITTNIPTGTGFGHFVNIHIMKLLGVLNRASYIDAYYFDQEITR
jgi:hypothetical protein